MHVIPFIPATELIARGNVNFHLQVCHFHCYRFAANKQTMCMSFCQKCDIYHRSSNKNYEILWSPLT